MTILGIIGEFNKSNSRNDKDKVMEKYKDHPLFLKVYQMTYDKVKYNYGVTIKTITTPDLQIATISLDEALDTLLSDFVTRKVTGIEARDVINTTLMNLNMPDAKVFYMILDRNLRINYSRKSYNKIVAKEHQCKVPPYMRCGILTERTLKKIKFPCLVQQKCDGTFRNIVVDAGEVTITTRSGIEDTKLPHLVKQFSSLPDGAYIGELLIRGITNRAEANGLLNSDRAPLDKVYVVLWDCVKLKEYADAKHKTKMSRETYMWRFSELKALARGNSWMEIVEHKKVNTLEEVLEITSEWISDGFEGGVLKDYNNVFKDHTSPTQLKIKVAFSIDVRITGFIEGKKNTKRVDTFGALMYETDDKKIQGTVSGFTDVQLNEINSDREAYIGRIMEVEGNAITKGSKKDYYAVSHPRFIEFRDDKTETDTLGRALFSLKTGKLFN